MLKRKPRIEKDNSERWLLTYADLMNLLLIFFIILYAMSRIDSGKFTQLSGALREVFGPGTAASLMGEGGGGNSLIDLGANAPSPTIPAKLEDVQLQEVRDKVSNLVETLHLKENVQVSVEERGIVISITEQLLFQSGRTDIETASRPTLEEIGKILLALPDNHIKVEGHTDNDPIGTSQYPSNWELSSARAASVVRLLIDKAGINPKYISAVGYGEYRPKVPNDTAANKALNRRVDIVIVKSAYDKSEAKNAAN